MSFTPESFGRFMASHDAAESLLTADQRDLINRWGKVFDYLVLKLKPSTEDLNELAKVANDLVPGSKEAWEKLGEINESIYFGGRDE